MRIHAERDNDHTQTIQTEKRNQKEDKFQTKNPNQYYRSRIHFVRFTLDAVSSKSIFKNYTSDRDECCSMLNSNLDGDTFSWLLDKLLF